MKEEFFRDKSFAHIRFFYCVNKVLVKSVQKRIENLFKNVNIDPILQGRNELCVCVCLCVQAIIDENNLNRLD